ncbi:MAG: hypothetical protein K2W85_07685 [Phycisphaerales bacterium]|nr:hypothetical protein [Phycisphaerales bacterium]
MKPLVTIASTLMICACAGPLGAFPMMDEPVKAPVAAPASASPTGTVLVLKNSGDEPKTKLRYTFTVGETARFELVQNVSRSESVEGQKPSDPIRVKTTTLFSTKVLSVDESGTATIEVKIDSMKSESPAMSAKEQADTNKLWSVFKNATGVLTCDARGADAKLEMSIPAALDQQLQRPARQLNGLIATTIVCLPEEPVGKNASWKAGSAAAIGKGQGRTIKLIEVSGTGAKIEHRDTFELRDTPLPADKVPQGMRGVIESQTMESTERRTVSLSGSVLSPGTFGTKSSSKVRLENSEGQEQGRNSGVVQAEFVLRRITN